DQLVLAREVVDADQAQALHVEVGLLLDLACDSLLGRLAGLEESGDQREGLRRPRRIAREQDLVAHLHERGDDGRRIVPVREAAFGAGAALAPGEQSGDERPRAARTESVVRMQHGTIAQPSLLRYLVASARQLRSAAASTSKPG